MTSKYEKLIGSISDYHYHGTSEPIKGILKGGLYDKILWTAENPAVAQNYIPESGMIMALYRPTFLEDNVCPNDIWADIAVLAGYEYGDLKFDEFKRLSSWVWYSKVPTYLDLVSFLEQDLGYVLDGNSYSLKVSYRDNKKRIHPANFKKEGELYFISIPKSLKIFDLTDFESDITNPQYNHLADFEAVKKAGYHGVRINDFAQSKNLGNVGHFSVGIFDDYVKDLSYFSIPAQNFDWSDSQSASFQLTPEYIKWFLSNNE